MDRNIKEDVSYNIKETSLSARRAWIEIAYGALEGASEMSLSARRAWIEISSAETAKTSNAESLSARRAWIEMTQCRL